MPNWFFLRFCHARLFGMFTDNPSTFVDVNAGVFDTPPIVNPKKNSPQTVTKAIRLKPSVTDYATFVATTSKVLGTTGPASRKTKPNNRLLSLMNLAS